jgi:hypothetical protein
MIEVVKESKELIEEFGIYEECVFCGNDTGTWHIKSNTPICEKCAKIKSLEDLK